ncbi:MAG: bifunctional diguanylate cyclase/phosphodiesterase [Gallionella sp.]
MFQLLRYFSIASFISMVVVGIFLGAVHRVFEADHLTKFGENHNIALTRTFANVIWPTFRDFAQDAALLDTAELKRHPESVNLDRVVHGAMRDTSTVKVKVINLNGRILYSSDSDEIGANYSADPGFISALNGLVLSESEHLESLNAIDGKLFNRDVLSSYVALRGGDSEPIEGVLEIYTDITDALADDLHQQQMVTFSVIGLLIVLYGILFFIVRHADRVIVRQRLEQHHAEVSLLKATTHDALTDLPNRLLLLDRLRQLVVANERRNSMLAVAYIDLDNFKNVNSSMGHEAGDEVLKILSKRLVACLREGDTIARIAGDDFVVTLPDIRSSVNLFQIAMKMLSAITLPIELDGRELHLTASIGIALSPEHGKDAEILMRNANIAMYNAKSVGGNRHQVFIEKMNEQVQQQVQLEEEMWRALGSNEFVLYYQPVIDLKTGFIVGAEALLRWPNSHGEWIAPTELIPLSEKCGLIAPLSEWVLTEACTQLQAWHEKGYLLNDFTMAVNLSPRHFASPGLAAVISDTVAQTEIDPRWLHLDISESILTGINEAILSNFEGIKRTGIKFSLDDFGTGFSSLGYLRNYPIDLLKIDRAFIKGLPEDADNAAIVTTIIAMANSLKLAVVAKGVESGAQMDFLMESGCHQAQGFLFSKPLPADQFLSLVLEHRDMRLTQSVIRFNENEQPDSTVSLEPESKNGSQKASSKPKTASQHKTSGKAKPKSKPKTKLHPKFPAK